GFAWQPDVKLKDKDAKEIELDIIAMCDGYLIVVECKNTLLLTSEGRKKEAIDELKAQLQRGIEAAIILGARLFLLATLEREIPTEIKEFIQAQDEKYQEIHIRLLIRSELIEGRFQERSINDNYQLMQNILGRYDFLPYYFDENCYSEDEIV
ncbi:MAG: hypothetical protein H7Y11_01025, partial [Armatimonadetes bacterium]|nr:hypothetical protein [Anaerolineae bacterium]